MKLSTFYRYCSKSGYLAAISNASTTSNRDVFNRRLENFQVEKKRQLSDLDINRKIEVYTYDHRDSTVDIDINNLSDESKLLMNAGKSTPFHCAKHLNQFVATSSALAFVDHQFCSMHQPLNKDKSLISFLKYDEQDHSLLSIVNNAFWRSCALALGASLEMSIAPQHEFISIGSSNDVNSVESGNFYYDVMLPTLPDWQPNNYDLNAISLLYTKRLRSSNIAFEPLTVEADSAYKIFEDSRVKRDMIDTILQHRNNVTLYRLGHFVDIPSCSDEPLISNIQHIGLFSVVAAHQIDSTYGRVHRFQGVALPYTQFQPAHIWRILCKNAMKLNQSPVFVAPQISPASEE